MFFVYSGLPSLGLRLSAMAAAVLAMTINLTAYAIEIMRAGIEAVPDGQRQAGRALGLRPALVFALLLLPHALSHVYPAPGSPIRITLLGYAGASPGPVLRLPHVAHLLQSRNVRAHRNY